MSKVMQLRAFREEDAESLANNADNPRVAQFLPEVFPVPYTVDDATWWVTIGHELGNVCNRAIIIDGKCAGSIGVTFLEGMYKHTAQLGYWIGEPHWGKGVMTRAVAEFVPQIMAEFQIKRLYAPVVHNNAASIGVLRKAGFNCEAVFKSNIFLRGRFYDEHIYAKYS